MADEEKQPASSAAMTASKEKLISLKGIILVCVILLIWTGALFYLLKGDKGKAKTEEVRSDTNNLKLFTRLLEEQSQVPPIKIVDLVVQIKLDKNGDTSKLLSCGFAFHLGLTAKEQKAIDENKWPPVIENTRFGQDIITEEEYTSPKPEWSLKTIIIGGESGGHGGGGKGVNPHSYLGYLTNMEVELKEKILHTLMQTTYSQINTDDGRNQVLEQLKNEANGLLKSLGKYPRVYKVSLVSFFFQP